MKKLPTLQPPETNYLVLYYQRRVDEAQQRLKDGMPIDFEQAKSDWCFLQRAKEPPVVRPVVQREAPKPVDAQQLLKELGFG